MNLQHPVSLQIAVPSPLQSQSNKTNHTNQPKEDTLFFTMVAFGEHLKANIAPEYGTDAYINYAELDDIIQKLSTTAPSG